MTEDVQYNPDAVPYFEGLQRGVVMVQRCQACSAAQFPPRVHCIACGDCSLAWEIVDGAGTVYAKTVNRRAAEENFEPLLPYVVALIDLDIGVRVLARATCPPEGVTTGMRVTVAPDPAPPLAPGLVFSPVPQTSGRG
jgi:uncharacterized OB-fold protein